MTNATIPTVMNPDASADFSGYRALTSGRYMVAPYRAAEDRGHRSAIGYFDSLSDACGFAHHFDCASNPVAVYDSEVRRGDDGIRSQEVYRTRPK